jgi:hypothetical protein
MDAFEPEPQPWNGAIADQNAPPIGATFGLQLKVAVDPQTGGLYFARALLDRTSRGPVASADYRGRTRPQNCGLFARNRRGRLSKHVGVIASDMRNN